MENTAEAPVEMDVSSLLSAAEQHHNPQAEQPAEQTQETQQQEQPKTEQPVEQKPADDGKPKKPWEKIKGEEQPKEEEKPKPEEQSADEKLPDLPGNASKLQKDAFTKLAFEAREAKRQAKALEAQLNELKNKPVETKPDETTLKELEELRTYRAAQDVRATPEWEANVTKPIEQVFSTLKGIAEFAKVDPAALEKATDPEQSWQRAIAIKNVFESAEEPVAQEVVVAAIQEAEKLQPLYAKAAEMESKAQELWRGLQNKSEAERLKSTEAQQKAFTEARSGLFEQIKVKFPTLFKDEAVAKEVSEAALGDDPSDQAYAAMAGQILPHLAQQLSEAKAEIAKLKASEATLLKARPSGGKTVEQTTQKPKSDDDYELDENELHSVFRSYSGR